MKIGVDIDDTTTKTWDTFYKEYAKLFNIPEEELYNDTPYYRGKIQSKCTLEEYFEIVRPTNDILTPNLPLKENAKEVIDKLYELGHTITFITARGKETTNPYETTKNYLDEHNIKYEKVILSPKDKASACIEEKIDLFIDDSIKHCTAVSEKGIEVLMFDNRHNKTCNKFKRVNNWDEIYEHIKSR